MACTWAACFFRSSRMAFRSLSSIPSIASFIRINSPRAFRRSASIARFIISSLSRNCAFKYRVVDVSEAISVCASCNSQLAFSYSRSIFSRSAFALCASCCNFKTRSINSLEEGNLWRRLPDNTLENNDAFASSSPVRPLPSSLKCLLREATRSSSNAFRYSRATLSSCSSRTLRLLSPCNAASSVPISSSLPGLHFRIVFVSRVIGFTRALATKVTAKTLPTTPCNTNPRIFGRTGSRIARGAEKVLRKATGGNGPGATTNMSSPTPTVIGSS
mmetsp:Transcript_11205/g.19033  ORF Transcript_11205/g.19033 Transcript_11205/m.19033 type:complete len:274 (+) Transcript_11205:606-1427(+)